MHMTSPRPGIDTTEKATSMRRPSAARSIVFMVMSAAVATLGAVGGIGHWTERARSSGLIAGESKVVEANLAFKDPLEIVAEAMNLGPAPSYGQVWADVTPPSNKVPQENWTPPTGWPAEKPPPYYLLTVTYPNQVDIGDSIKLTFELASPIVKTVEPGDVTVQASSGALEWSGQDMKQTISKGQSLPTRIFFTPSAKDTGKASIVIRAEAPNPIEIVTSSGGDAAVPGTAADSASNALGMAPPAEAAKPMQPKLKPGAMPGISSEIAQFASGNLSANDTVDVMVLTKWHISDRYVHWVTTLGWIIGTIGVGAFAKFAYDLWRKISNKGKPDAPEPGNAHT